MNRINHITATLCAQNRVNIHALVKYANDFDLLASGLLIKNDVTALWKLTVTFSNFITRFSDVRVFRK